MSRRACVYILTNKNRRSLYVGVTTDLRRRLMQHRSGEGSAFARKYRVHRLVYIEWHDMIAEAILREKRVKNWRRDWKDALIESVNPDWRDLSEELLWL